MQKIFDTTYNNKIKFLIIKIFKELSWSEFNLKNYRESKQVKREAINMVESIY